VYRFLNAYTIALAETDPAYRRLLLRSELNHPDGRPIAPVLNMIHGPGRFQHVRGPNFFRQALVEGCASGVRHFFLGGSEETLDALLKAIGLLAPEACIAGFYSPPFGQRTSDELAAQDKMIEEAYPDIVWVGLGTPKQDFEADRLAEALQVNVAAVGAAFDFTAGAKRVAPALVSRLWLEWLYRLLTEPRRLLWRYVWGNSRFLVAAIRAIARSRREGPRAPSVPAQASASTETEAAAR
jgi:N-acetylglucosaminyldiphosphoundecaprenol N-acetyl-beta-D-mannosaminyltransferase